MHFDLCRSQPTHSDVYIRRALTVKYSVLSRRRILIFSLTSRIMTQFSSSEYTFERDTNGNYQARVGNTNTRVTIQTYAGKTYVDIRDYFATKESVFLPTRRGITLSKAKWDELCAKTGECGTALLRIHEDIDKGKHVALPVQFDLSGEVQVSIRQQQYPAFYPRAYKVVIADVKHPRNPLSPKEVALKPLDWYNIVTTNRERINELMLLLDKEASLSAAKRKEDLAAAERELFQATWSIPNLPSLKEE